MHKNTNQLGATVDQVAAKHIGRESLLPSLEIGIESASNSCGEGWSCAYRDTISWLDEQHAAARRAQSPGAVRASLRHRRIR